MEFIKHVSQFEKMIDNKIIGMPKLIDSEITFMGKNNILICDNNIELKNVVLKFNNNNSIVFLASKLDTFFLSISNNSSVFIGRNTEIQSNVEFHVFEGQNIIIGDDCYIGNAVSFHTSDNFPIYRIDNKSRVNFSSSIYVGDHVAIGNNSYISKGVKIGSGSIIDNFSYIESNVKIPSNVFAYGNPIKLIKGIFFTKESLSLFKHEDTLNSKHYKSDVFIYNVINQETLDLNKIDKILNDLDVESRLDFINKLFVRNKRKNRFCME